MNKQFGSILGSSFLASMGDKFFAISLSWWILNESGIADTGATLGVVMALTSLATMVSGPLLGSLADIYDKCRCMLVSMITSVAVIVVLLSLYNYLVVAPVIIFTVAILLGIGASFFVSTLRGCLSSFVSRDYIPTAVSLLTITTPTSQVIGSAVAGFAIAAYGVRGSVACDLILYIVGLLLLVVVILPTNTKSTRPNNVMRPKYFDTLRGGLHYMQRERRLFNSLLYFAAVNLFATPMFLLMPLLATTFYKGDSVALAMMEGSNSLGLIVFSLLLAHNKRPFNRHTAVFVSIFVLGICQTAIGVLCSGWFTYVMLFFCGSMLGVANISLNSIYQIYVPDEMKGRFFSLMMVMVRAASPLGLAAVGFCSDAAGPLTIMLVNGIAIMTLSVVWLKLKKLDFNYTF